MAGKREPYETKRINATWGDGKVRKLLALGWEIVSDTGGMLLTGRTVIMRRPNPKYVARGGK